MRGPGVHLPLVARLCFVLVCLASKVADAGKPPRSWNLRAEDEHVQRVSNHCSDGLLFSEMERLLAAFSVQCDPPSRGVGGAGPDPALRGVSTTPLSKWARFVRSGPGGDDGEEPKASSSSSTTSSQGKDVFVPVLIASAGGPTAQLLYDALAELGTVVRAPPGPKERSVPEVMYRPLPAAKRWLEARRIRVRKAVYVVDGKAGLKIRSPHPNTPPPGGPPGAVASSCVLPHHALGTPTRRSGAGRTRLLIPLACA